MGTYSMQNLSAQLDEAFDYVYVFKLWPLGPLIIICIDSGREILALNFYWLCVTILHLILNKVGQFYYSLDFIEISPFLICFESRREPLMRFQTFLYSLTTIV